MKQRLLYFLLFLLPLLGASGGAHAQAYDPNEVAALKTFFAQISADGVTTNGAKLGVTDIDTWNPAKKTAFILWSGNPQRASTLQWTNKGLAGTLNLSALAMLATARLDTNKLTSITFASTSTVLTDVRCNNNLLTSLQIPNGVVRFGTLTCQNNKLTSLILPTNMTRLYMVNISNNQLEQLAIPATSNTYDGTVSFFNCDGNKFKFSTIPVTNVNPTPGRFIFTPQSLIDGHKVIYTDGIDLSSEYSITKNATTQTTVYSWFDITGGSEVAITMGTDITDDGLGHFTLASSLVGKKLRCKMTNANFIQPAITPPVTIPPTPPTPAIPLILEYEVEVVATGTPVYDYAGEIAALKAFFAQTSADRVNNNGSKLGIANVSTWDPTAEAASLTWTNTVPRRLETVSWSGKGLAGELNLSACTQMTTFDISHNELVKIQAPLSFASLTTFNCEDNQLKFSTLPTGSLTGYVYAPQDTIRGGITYERIDLSGEYSITNGATATTVYEWFDITSGTEVPVTTGLTSNGNGIFTLASSFSNATLLCKMTNSGYPDMSAANALLYKVKVAELPSYSAQDCNALKDFFSLLSADGTNNNGSKLGVTAIETWDPAVVAAGITWDMGSPKRLAGISWTNKQLAGVLNVSLCDSLKSLVCDQNALTGIKLVADSSALRSLSCKKNMLTLAALPKAYGLAVFPPYGYAPQNTISWEVTYLEGIDLSADYETVLKGTTAPTTFTWFDITDGSETPITLTSTGNGKFGLTIDFVDHKLRCKVTNANFPAFTGANVLIYEVNVVLPPPYNTAELSVLRQFFAQTGSDGIGSNGEAFGIYDPLNWDPSTNPAGVAWSMDNPKRVEQIVFTFKTEMAGELDLTIFEALTRVEVNRTKLQSLILPTNAPKLYYVWCQESNLTNLVMPLRADTLRGIHCDINKLTSFKFPDYAPNFDELVIDSNRLTTITVPDHIKKKLETLWVRNNKLTEINLPDTMPKLRYFYFTNNQMSEFTLPASTPSLEHFWCDANSFRFSTLPKQHINPAYRYAPQDTIYGGTVSGAIVDLKDEYLISRDGLERATIYTWYEINNEGEKVGDNIEGFNVDPATGIIAIPAAAANKKVRCEMRNLCYNGGEAIIIGGVDFCDLTIVYEAYIGDALLNQMTVNGNPVDITTGTKFSYMAECGATQATINVSAVSGAVVKVNGAPYAAGMSVALKPESATAIKVDITTGDGVVTEWYTLNVAASLTGSKMFKQRWNDVLTIVNNTANNGGLNLVEYRWYKNGVLVENQKKGYLYEQGGLDPTAVYTAEAKTKAGVWYKICAASIKKMDALMAYPNPVRSGEAVTIQLPEGETEATTQVFDAGGRLKKSRATVRGNASKVDMPTQPGVYLIQVQVKDREPEVVKVIVQ